MISNIGEGATPLMYACQQSREREVFDLIARKRNSVRERDRTLKTALHYCTENSSTGCAEAVLRAAPELLDAKDEDGYTALHLAVIAGNKTFLRFLISRGANVNASDNERHSAVHWATVCGEEEALDIIIRAGADISTADIHGGYPLHYAAQMCGPGGEMGRDPKIGLRILNILLSHNIDINVKDKDGRQPILWAASAGSADAILALVKAGASVEASDKDGLTALHCAASRGHTDCIETLVTLCGSHIDVIDTNGCTALFYAVTLGHADSTQLLLSLGAEPNRQDRKGRTPAHCGAAKGQLETLRILLNYGANLWLRNVKGDFPLHEAVASGRRELVRWLLNQRLDSINVGNNDGRCPIHIAAINNNIDMLKILLDAQSLVNPVMRTTKGELMTPLDAALHRGFRGCAKYLQLHGGVPFTKLTEKSCNIRGVLSTHINSEISPENYDQMWSMAQNSSTSFMPIQIRMGGDKAIQQIETSDLRAVTRIPEGYEDVRSSDEEKMNRRRRRRKKSEYQRKSYISEEDSNFEEDEYQRRQRSVEDGQGKHYEEWSSDEMYKNKTKKRSYVVESDEAMERAYYSATEDSENERNRERKRRARKKESQKGRARSEHSRRDSNGRKPVSRLTVAEVHESPGNFTDETKTEEATLVSVGSSDDKRRDMVEGKKRGSDVAAEAKILGNEKPHPTITVLDDDEEPNKNETEVTESFIETKDSVQLESLPDLSHEMAYLQNSPYNGNEKKVEAENDEKNVEESFMNEVRAEIAELTEEKSATSAEGESVTRTEEKEEDGKNNKAGENEEDGEKEKSEEEEGDRGKEKTEDEKEKEDKKENEGAEENEGDEEKEKAEEKEENEENEGAEENGKNEENGENGEKEGNGKNAENEENGKNAENEENGKNAENEENGKNAENEENGKNGENEGNGVNGEKEVVEQKESEEEEKETEEIEEIEDAENIAVEDPEPQEAEREEEFIDDDTANAPEENQSEANLDLTEDISDRAYGEEPEEKDNLITELISDQEEYQDEEQEEEEEEEEIEEGMDKNEEENEYIPSAFEVLDSAVSEKLPLSRTSSRNNFDGSSSRRGSVSGGIDNRQGDPDGSIGDESGGSTRNEDSSALMDSGIEPSPRRTLREQKEGPNVGTIRTRVPRLCNKGKEPEEIHTVSVTQTVQNTIRKYHVERKIFYQLLELKRLQIRAGRANEQVLVKRLVDEYRRGGIIPGLQNYSGPFTFTQFEKFLYDQLRTLQSTARILIPKLRPSDDIETLSTILRKSRVELVDDIPENPMFCTLGTHRCHHAAHAYTGIPCAAYITKVNHHEMPKTRTGGFLPQIDQTYTERPSGQQTSYRPVTLEVSHGKEKQVISLPTDRLDKNKRYYVTFTIKGGPSLEESKSSHEERMLRHRHAKSF